MSEGIYHPFFYGDLVYKLRIVRRVKCEANYVSSGSKTVKPLTLDVERRPSDHREDDRSCAWPFFNLEQIFPKALDSDYKGRGLYDGSRPKLLGGDKALIIVPSDCKSGLLQSLDLSSLPVGRSKAYSFGCLYLHEFLILILFYHRACWSSVFKKDDYLKKNN